mgnify:CR=1 FL=1
MPLIKNAHVLRINAQESIETIDFVAIEAPLEISLHYPSTSGTQVDEQLMITMQTPGHESDLAIGYLFGEGLISSASDITAIELNSKESGSDSLEISLDKAPTRSRQSRQRGIYMNSGCGLCGKDDLSGIHFPKPPDFEAMQPLLKQSVLSLLSERLHQGQNGFRSTGGLHAAALFTPEGDLIELREDIGRHNALDKLIGAILKKDPTRFEESILFLSSRLSFELIQKSLTAGIAIVAGVGAPSSLAVELSNRYRQTLIGFVRDDRFNIYSHPQRVNITHPCISSR